jgi:hypothetical protein
MPAALRTGRGRDGYAPLVSAAHVLAVTLAVFIVGVAAGAVGVWWFRDRIGAWLRRRM